MKRFAIAVLAAGAMSLMAAAQDAPAGDAPAAEPAPAPAPEEPAEHDPAEPLPTAALAAREFIIFYEPGKVAIPDDAEALLPQITEIYKRLGYKAVRIECHSDKQATPEAAVELTAKRAERIKSTLVLYGVPAEAITDVAAGFSDPLVEAAPDVAISNRRCIVTLS